MVDISISTPTSFSNELEVFSTQINESTQVKVKYQKLKVVLLTIFLGHFGVHRIYLGTSANVPIVYSATLGGGLGVLPLLDLIAILSTNDIEQFKDNNKVFMWSKKTKRD